jgi:hypothetical protein
MACTEMTLPQSSGANTPLAGQKNGIESVLKVVSAPQPPRANMRSSTPEEADKHYKLFACKKGFGIWYKRAPLLPQNDIQPSHIYFYPNN